MTDHEAGPDSAAATPSGAAERAGRLPGLWVVCVLLGLGGVFYLSLVFLATPLGVVVFGSFGAAHVAAALSLWKRSPWSWRGAVCLTALECGLWGFCAALRPSLSVAHAASPLLVYGAILAYLLLREPRFGRTAAPPLRSLSPAFAVAAAPRPRSLSPAFAVAAALVLMLGAAWTTWLTFDEPRRDFPRLKAQRPAVPAGENAYVALADVARAFPQHLGELSEIEKAESALALGATAAPGSDATAARAPALAGARALVELHGPVLERADAILAKAAFRAPDYETLDEKWKAEEEGPFAYVKYLAHLLALRSDVKLAEGDAAGAWQDAARILRLGDVVAGGSDSFTTDPVGLAVLRVGLEQARRVAGSPDVPRGILKANVVPAGLGRTLQASFEGAVCGEFWEFDQYVSLAKVPGMLEDLGGGPPLPCRRIMTPLLADAMPLIKRNMTVSLLGDLMLRYLTAMDVYGPEPAARRAYLMRFQDFVASVGWRRFFLNPYGHALVQNEAPAISGVLEEHYAVLAEARMTDLYVALRAWQLDHGRLPESVGNLVPDYIAEVPLDPFPKKPFGYEPAGTRPRIWSVGPDRKEDEVEGELADDVVIPLDFAAGAR
jgi:hypothetical protein